MKFIHKILLVSLFGVTVAHADCPSAVAYLQGSFSQAKLLMAKNYSGRIYTNGPVCSDTDYELRPSALSDLSGCVAGDRPLTNFAVIGLAKPDLPLNVRYIFAGTPLSKADVEALLKMPLMSAERVPGPLDQMISKSEVAELYQSKDRRYLVRFTSDSLGATVMVIRVATIKPASEAILACVDAQRPKVDYSPELK